MVRLIITAVAESTTIIMVDITIAHIIMVAEHIIGGTAHLFIDTMADHTQYIVDMGILAGEDNFNTFLTLRNFFFSNFISIFATQKQ